MEITYLLHAPLSKLSGYRTTQSLLFLRQKYTFQYIAEKIVRANSYACILIEGISTGMSYGDLIATYGQFGADSFFETLQLFKTANLIEAVEGPFHARDCPFRLTERAIDLGYGGKDDR